MRKAIIAGNWKMYKSPIEAFQFTEAFKTQVSPNGIGLDVCLFPNYLSIPIVAHELQQHLGVYVGAQNSHIKAEGAYTGETSVGMIKDAGATHILVGHSERREYFGEDNALLLEKTNTVISQELTAVYCCGEKLEDRKAGNHFDLVGNQIKEVVNQISADKLRHLVIAYEPVWAIGTGETASPEQAQEMHAHIRSVLAEQFGEAANDVSILYGGSVKPSNAQELFSQADIDGGLVGGASLKVADFVEIIKAMQNVLS